jgi:hypothetical protein
MPSQNQRAGATINCSTILVASTTEPNTALQANSATRPPIGIAVNYNRANPDPAMSDATALIAALVNETIGVHYAGETGIDLLCAATWAPGDLIMADSNGQGIVATSGNWFVARAQSAGVIGALCPVDVLSPAVCGTIS